MIEIICGNNLQVLQTMDDCSVDSIVTDPPYGLSKEPDALLMLTAWINEGHFDHKGKGFMGKEWDAFVPQPIFWRECLRVLKPGGHLASFGGTRTFDLITLGLRLAGFEIRDVLSWNYGSGFPKSLDISKSIDKQKGLVRAQGAPKTTPDGKTWADRRPNGQPSQFATFNKSKEETDRQLHHLLPASPEAKQYDGFGTALKPAYEPIILCRKPISEKNIAENVLRWGTGGLNLKACRVEGENTVVPQPAFNTTGSIYNMKTGVGRNGETSTPDGRFPPNVIFDSHTAKLLDEQSGCLTSGAGVKSIAGHNGGNGVTLNDFKFSYSSDAVHGDSGGASRFFPIIDFDVEIDTPFFYEGKAQTKERNAGVRNAGVGALRDGGRESVPRGNYHPTVKPVRLMEWLVKLITPIDGIVLEPYLGSGTTAVACKRLGYSCIGIEMNEEYVEIAKKRVDAVPESLFDEVKEKKLKKQAEQIAIQL